MTNLERYWIGTSLLRIKVFLFCICVIASAHAQQEFKFKDLEACAVLHSGMTLEKAQQRAVDNLKMKALQKAGVTERVSSNRLYEDNSADGSSNYYETTFSELYGDISYIDILETTRSVGENNEVLVCVKGRAHVLRYKPEERKPYSISLKGLKDFYENQDLLEFSLSAYDEAYFWVFYIDDAGGYSLLFPRDNTQRNLIAEGQSISLPGPFEQWTVGTEHPDRESNQLLVVCNPEDIMADPNIKDFNSWSKWYQKLNTEKRTKYIHRLIILNQ